MSRGRIIRWMLEEVEAEYHTEYLDYGSTMKAPEYLRINPMGKVPAIKHGDQVVTECAAICAYLADAFPDAGLAPEPSDRASYYRWLFFFAGPVESAVVNSSMNVVVPEDKQGMVGYGSLETVLDTIETALDGNPGYIAGERFSAADVYVAAHIGWGMQFGTIDNRPAFEAYYAKVSDRPAHRRAAELDDAAMPDQG